MAIKLMDMLSPRSLTRYGVIDCVIGYVIDYVIDYDIDYVIHCVIDYVIRMTPLHDFSFLVSRHASISRDLSSKQE